MYTTALTERIRKRKAFADSELDLTSGLLSVSPNSTLTATGAPTYPFIQNAYHTFQPQNPSNSNNHDSNNHYYQNKLLSPTLSTTSTTTTPTPPASYENNAAISNDLHLHYSMNFNSNLLPKIRIIDESKLKRNRTEFSSSFELTSSSSSSSVHILSKPKISFSIESIIGIQ